MLICVAQAQTANSIYSFSYQHYIDNGEITKFSALYEFHNYLINTIISLQPTTLPKIVQIYLELLNK